VDFVGWYPAITYLDGGSVLVCGTRGVLLFCSCYRIASTLYREAYVKILGINGAPAKTGAVAALLSESLQAAAEEIAELGETPNTTVIHLVDVVKEFHDGSFTNIPTSLQSTFDNMTNADGFLFATPVHWFNMSALMKCFIDWLTSLEQDTCELEGKVAGVLAHCNEDGGNQAATSIISPLLHMGMLVPPYSGFFRNQYMALQSEAGWQAVDHRLVGKNVVRLAACARFNKRGWN
jgi:multimeric flavodoxin WrbA